MFLYKALESLIDVVLVLCLKRHTILRGVSMNRLNTQVLVQFKLEVVLYDSIWVDAVIVALAMSLLLGAAIS